MLAPQSLAAVASPVVTFKKYCEWSFLRHDNATRNYGSSAWTRWEILGLVSKRPALGYIYVLGYLLLSNLLYICV